MNHTNLEANVQFVVDADGHRTAVLVDLDTWQALLAHMGDPALPEAGPAPAADAGHSVFDLIGAYASPLPWLDGISPSEDADLYLLVEALGDQTAGLHAWEIAPGRYRPGPGGQAIRIQPPADRP